MKEAERKLMEKGYYLSNQFDGFGTVPNEYELADRNGNTVIDHDIVNITLHFFLKDV